MQCSQLERKEATTLFMQTKLSLEDILAGIEKWCIPNKIGEGDLPGKCFFAPPVSKLDETGMWHMMSICMYISCLTHGVELSSLEERFYQGCCHFGYQPSELLAAWSERSHTETSHIK